MSWQDEEAFHTTLSSTHLESVLYGGFSERRRKECRVSCWEWNWLSAFVLFSDIWVTYIKTILLYFTFLSPSAFLHFFLISLCPWKFTNYSAYIRNSRVLCFINRQFVAVMVNFPAAWFHVSFLLVGSEAACHSVAKSVFMWCVFLEWWEGRVQITISIQTLCKRV